MGIGDFVDDYRGKLVEDSTKAWLDAPSTWDKGNAEEQWEIIKQSAKAAGMSVLDWFSEVAFKGSQNPEGMAQEALGAASYPFRKASEVAIDYLSPSSGFMHSEQMPEWLSGLNDPAMRRHMIQNLGPVAATAMLGGLGVGVNKWAEGEDVLKGDVIDGVGTLAAPFLPYAMGGRAATRAPRSPSMHWTDAREDADDFIVDAFFEEAPIDWKKVKEPLDWKKVREPLDESLETKLKSKGYETDKTLDDLIADSKAAQKPNTIFNLSADDFYEANPKFQNKLMEDAGLSRSDIDAYFYVTEARNEYLAMESVARRTGDTKMADEVADTIEEMDDAVLTMTDSPVWDTIDTHLKGVRAFSRTQAFKPSHVDASEWEKLTKGLSKEEAMNLARKMTLRIVD